MALKIRLTRLGAKGDAFYRVVVAESRSPRDGKFVEILGTFDPTGKTDDAIKINRDIAMSWLAKGVQPTDTARALLTKAGIMEKKTVAKKTSPAKKPAVKAEKKEKK